MKLNKIYALSLAGLAFVACDDVDEMAPGGYLLTANQVQESVVAIPNRGEATFAGMFSMMGMPDYCLDNSRSDDFGFIMMAISQDAEGPDMTFPNSGYNWFSVCGELTSRTPTYANPRIRYMMPYNQIGVANELIKTYQAATEGDGLNKKAQAKAMRAFDYLSLAPYFQYNYATSKDKPCVPIVTEEPIDFTANARASVAEVYELVIEDLTFAIENLTSDRADKSKINKNVAYGLRARAYLAMGEYAKAAADAEKAMEGYTPASISEVSIPAFYEISDHNWIWGIDMSMSMVQENSYATSPSWIGSFSADSYSAGVACYASINKLLFDKIPSTDVRKGWWVDENVHSDNLESVSWGGYTGDDLASMTIPDVKEPYFPYVNVKFGMNEIGSSNNDSDWPLMRVEEMILIAAEGYAKSGNEAKAKEILVDFVTKYRDPEYKVPVARSLADEIWFQRRVELWGEGFATSDVMRLNKPLVRYHAGEESNLPDAYQFNMKSDDPWLLMRFPQSETNTNLAIVNNEGGVKPVAGQNGELRDGVTD